MFVKIKDMPENDRPRERFTMVGAENLTNEELIAIILKTGTKNSSAKDLARQILFVAGGIENLINLDYNTLLNIKGIKSAKAMQVMSTIEISKRINKRQINIKERINTPDIVYSQFKYLENKKQEEFHCIYLDTKKRMICLKKLYIGTINQSVIHPREIYKEAYLNSASAIICIHNHPSGNPKPSNEDIRITKILKDVGNISGIPIVDHVIIGKSAYYSFKENGLI